MVLHLHSHPGTVLMENFLIPLNISAYRLSKITEIPQTRISRIIKGQRRITTDTALRFASFFGNSAQYWLDLQNRFDIEKEKHSLKEKLALIRKNALKYTQQ